MGKTKFNRFKGVRKRRRNKPVVVPMTFEEAAAEARPIPDEENEINNGQAPSASSKKLEFFGLKLDEMVEMTKQTEPESQDKYFLMVDKVSLNKLLSCLCCPNCKVPGIEFDTYEEKHMGFCAKGYVYCGSCETVINEGYLSERIGGSHSTNRPFEVNTRSVFAFMGIGCGYTAMRDWSTIMNFPNCPNKYAYQSTKEKLISASKETFDEVATKSVEIIRQKHAELGELPDKNNILDIAVSYDGTWQRRGHSSHNGAGIVIDLLTGLPIDYEVVCNFCHQCFKAPGRDDPEYTEWQTKHQAKCAKNYDGSANSMEQECANRIWQRSVAKHGLRYTTMLSDGDSKSFEHLKQNEVYGKEVEIFKEECVNHVSKRMGTALNNVIQDCKAQRQSISGKGKLTKEKVLKIQNYYGRAIKDNAHDPALAKKRIFAILFHLTSTDRNPKHVHCPPGENSWCFWQRAIARQENPGPHKEHETIAEDIGKKLVPIFQRLTDDSLLRRCTRNRTQNPNESLHNVIWRFCPKITFVGRKTLESATCLALCQFAKGATFQETLFEFLGIDPGHYLKQGSLRKSIERLKKADIASTNEAKQKRKRLKYAKVTKEKAKKTKEGDTYKAGSFA